MYHYTDGNLENVWLVNGYKFHQTRWEKSGNIPPWADKLIRLLYLAHAERELPIASAVERINTIERAQKQRIVLRSAKSGWAAKLLPEPA